MSEEKIKLLKSVGLKVTEPRLTILQLMQDTRDEMQHFSAEDIYKLLLEHHSEIGLATVYRALDLLSKLGILVQVDFCDGCARYELNTADPKIHHHHHLICLKCKKVIEFDEDLLDVLEGYISKKSGFEILNHEVKFFGYCKDCREEV